MKKLFISCPVKGRKLNDVIKTRKKMHEIAQIIFDQELEVIDSIQVHEINDGDTFESLSRHINCMKDADYFIGCHFNPFWNDCYIEGVVARQSNINNWFIDIDIIAPDAAQIESPNRKGYSDAIYIC